MNIPIPNALTEMLSSKKFLMALAGVAVIVLDKVFNWQVSDETMLTVLGLIATYIIGQGIADAGKEAVKIEQQNGGQPKPPQ